MLSSTTIKTAKRRIKIPLLFQRFACETMVIVHPRTKPRFHTNISRELIQHFNSLRRVKLLKVTTSAPLKVYRTIIIRIEINVDPKYLQRIWINGLFDGRAIVSGPIREQETIIDIRTLSPAQNWSLFVKARLKLLVWTNEFY